MEEPGIALSKMELKTGHIILDFPVQRSMDEYYKEAKRLILGRRRRHEELPFNLQITTEESTNQGIRTIVLQVINSAALYIGKEKLGLSHGERHLTELACCVWGSRLSLEEVSSQTEHRLENLGDYNLHLLLSRSFEVQGIHEDKLSYLCLVMTWSKWCELKQHSFEVGLMMQREMSEDYKFAFGLTKEEALQNMKKAEKAGLISWLVFAQLSRGDVSLTPVEDFELALPYFKRFAFAGYPSLVNFKQQMSGQRLRDYLQRA